MAVYVDDMRAPFGNLIMCHMLADTDDELHTMADALGIKRIWWQSPEKTSGSHYDICLTKKAIALRRGAIPITRRQAAAMNAHRKVHGFLNTPAAAMDWLISSKGLRRTFAPADIGIGQAGAGAIAMASAPPVGQAAHF